jgi:hypothetical protein
MLVQTAEGNGSVKDRTYSVIMAFEENGEFCNGSGQSDFLVVKPSRDEVRDGGLGIVQLLRLCGGRHRKERRLDCMRRN